MIASGDDSFTDGHILNYEERKYINTTSTIPFKKFISVQTIHRRTQVIFLNDYSKFLRECEQFLDKCKLDTPIIKCENKYPTRQAPFIKIERRNRLIGKREKRIGLKR